MYTYMEMYIVPCSTCAKYTVCLCTHVDATRVHREYMCHSAFASYSKPPAVCSHHVSSDYPTVSGDTHLWWKALCVDHLL